IQCPAPLAAEFCSALAAADTKQFRKSFQAGRPPHSPAADAAAQSFVLSSKPPTRSCPETAARDVSLAVLRHGLHLGGATACKHQSGPTLGTMHAQPQEHSTKLAWQPPCTRVPKGAPRKETDPILRAEPGTQEHPVQRALRRSLSLGHHLRLRSGLSPMV